MSTFKKYEIEALRKRADACRDVTGGIFTDMILKVIDEYIEATFDYDVACNSLKEVGKQRVEILRVLNQITIAHKEVVDALGVEGRTVEERMALAATFLNRVSDKLSAFYAEKHESEHAHVGRPKEPS